MFRPGDMTATLWQWWALQSQKKNDEVEWKVK